eukprot:1017753-Prymnesium_polylepis.2
MAPSWRGPQSKAISMYIGKTATSKPATAWNIKLPALSSASCADLLGVQPSAGGGAGLSALPAAGFATAAVLSSVSVTSLLDGSTKMVKSAAHVANAPPTKKAGALLLGCDVRDVRTPDVARAGTQAEPAAPRNQHVRVPCRGAAEEADGDAADGEDQDGLAADLVRDHALEEARSYVAARECGEHHSKLARRASQILVVVGQDGHAE